MTRLLLLVPHPDDEVVGCFAAIKRARAAGAELFALYLTTGVPAAHEHWPWTRRRHAARVARRREEAREVARALGIVPIAFTEWPSRSLRTHLGEARALVAEAVRRHAVDAAWGPAYEGGHQDHDAASFVLANLPVRVRALLEFAEYNFAGGRVRCNDFPERTGAERELALSADEAAAKRRALAVYASERANLAHVRSERECLRPLARHDYSRPPHPGRLFYQRFQWIPFRHPRVDFTSPEEVCAAFASRP